MSEFLDINDFKKEEETFNGVALHKKLYINPKDKLEHPPIALSCGDSFGEATPIVTYGNFACIVGASKSMKSFFKSALLACYIGGSAQTKFDDIVGHETTGKFIIDIDTEQSEYHAQKASNRVLNMVGSDNGFYKMFALRSITPKERVQFIEWLFNESPYKNKIGLCSIDGVADLIENVNDLDKSNEITQKLMQLSADNKTAILTILHRNFDSDKPTGHLGSAILKKAESVIFVNKDHDLVTVAPKYTRNIAFQGFTFSVDNNGLPYKVKSNF